MAVIQTNGQRLKSSSVFPVETPLVVFQNDCNISLFQQQYMRIPDTPGHRQTLSSLLNYSY